MKEKSKKILNIVANVLIYLFVAVGLFTVMITIFSKRDVDGTVNVFGKEMRIVQTASMEKNPNTDVSQYKVKDIPTGSMVFIDLVPTDDDKADEWYSKLKVGDVLTYKYYIANTQYTITHRITDIQANSDGGYTIRLRGDNVESEDSAPGGIIVQEINTAEKGSFNYVIGKVTGKSKVLGFIVVGLKKPIVLCLLVIVPCVIIIILEIVRIITVLNSDKKKKNEEEKKKQSDEIEELKKQLEALKQGKSGMDVDESKKEDDESEILSKANEEKSDGEQSEQ